MPLSGVWPPDKYVATVMQYADPGQYIYIVTFVSAGAAASLDHVPMHRTSIHWIGICIELIARIIAIGLGGKIK